MSVDQQRQPKESRRCELSGELLPRRKLVVVDHLRPTIADRIRQDYPLLGPDALISRAEADRLRSLNDYRVNLKAELEIRHLHEKLDHLISRQWQRLAEIQELQIELLQERR